MSKKFKKGQMWKLQPLIYHNTLDALQNVLYIDKMYSENVIILQDTPVNIGNEELILVASISLNKLCNDDIELIINNMSMNTFIMPYKIFSINTKYLDKYICDIDENKCLIPLMVRIDSYIAQIL